MAALGPPLRTAVLATVGPLNLYSCYSLHRHRQWGRTGLFSHRRLPWAWWPHSACNCRRDRRFHLRLRSNPNGGLVPRRLSNGRDRRFSRSPVGSGMGIAGRSWTRPPGRTIDALIWQHRCFAWGPSPAVSALHAIGHDRVGDRRPARESLVFRRVQASIFIHGEIQKLARSAGLRGHWRPAFRSAESTAVRIFLASFSRACTCCV